MSEKKSPALWIEHLFYEGESQGISWDTKPLRDHEPYIPLSRVRAKLAEKLGGGHCCQAWVHQALEELIEEVEKDAKDGR